MPILKQKEVKPHLWGYETRNVDIFSGLKKVFAKAKEKIVDIKEAITEMVAPQTTTIPISATIENIVTFQKDPDEVWLLNTLGNSSNVTSYFEELKRIGLSFKEIRHVVDVISKCEYFTITEILTITAVDFKAILHIARLGRLSATDAPYVYGRLSDFLCERLNSWLTEIYTSDLKLVMFMPSSGMPAEEQLNEILKYYTIVSQRKISAEISICLRLLKLALAILTGIVLPRNRTLQLIPIWFMMINDMFSLSYYNKMNCAGLTFAIMIENIAFLYREEMTAVLSYIGTLSSAAWDTLPSKAQNWITHSTDMIFSTQSSKKYLCWNKTLSVLINKAISEQQASRMLSTFTFGSTIKDSLRLSLSDSVFIKRLSPIPTRSSVYEIISFFRNAKDYIERRENAFAIADREIQKTDDPKIRIKTSYDLYFILLKLEIAYIPNNSIKGASGCFIDTTDIKINKSLIEEISKRHHPNQNNNFIKKHIGLKSYKNALQKVIEKNPKTDYIDFFGYPKNSFFLIGNNTKYYTPNN